MRRWQKLANYARARRCYEGDEGEPQNDGDYERRSTLDLAPAEEDERRRSQRSVALVYLIFHKAVPVLWPEIRVIMPIVVTFSFPLGVGVRIRPRLRSIGTARVPRVGAVIRERRLVQLRCPRRSYWRSSGNFRHLWFWEIGFIFRVGPLRVFFRLVSFSPLGSQVYFALSSQQEWYKTDGSHFNYEEFFWTIYGLFDNDAWGKEIIAMWNKVVLGTSSAPAPAAAAAAGPSALEQLKAARAAAAAAAAAPAPAPATADPASAVSLPPSESSD
ncbi:hypothetical protein FB451DRAFT_1180864 [Mycena latifolia]|nr:hypothetical protein FB451DRAFT_1180864 [Mycena latifolia]